MFDQRRFDRSGSVRGVLTRSRDTRSLELVVPEDIVHDAFVARHLRIWPRRCLSRLAMRISSNKIRDFIRRERDVNPVQGGSTAMVGLRQLPEEASVPGQQPTDSEQIHALLHHAFEQVRDEFETRTWHIFECNLI